MSEVKLDLVEVVGPRLRRSAEERLQIVEESYVHGMSVARVARKYGINANQVFGVDPTFLSPGAICEGLF